MTDSGQRLRNLAGRFGRHQTQRVLATAAARGGGVALVLLSALLAFDHFAPGVGAPGSFGPLLVRAIGFLAVVLVPTILLAREARRRLPAHRDLEESARRTEGQASALREHLVPALQVLRIRDDGRTRYSPDLVDAFVEDTVRLADTVEPSALPYNRDLRRALRWAVAGVVAAAGVLVSLGPAEMGRGVFHLATALGHLGPQPRALFVIEPGDVSIPRDQDVRLTARVDYARLGRDGARARLEWRADEQSDWKGVDLAGVDVSATGPDGAERVPSARFEHAFGPVKDSFTYRFEHAGEISATHRVEAVPRPSLAIESVRYRYPKYTALPDRVVKDGSGDLTAVRGTVAWVRIRSTNDPASGTIEFGTGETRPLAIDDDRHLQAEIEIAAEGTYRLNVEDALGLTNPNPLEYRVRALTDEAPFIRLLEPGKDVDLDESMRVGLRFSAVDDYGLGPVRLVWESSRREGETASRVVWSPDGTQVEAGGRFEWDLSALDLLPGDTVAYHLEVSDNNVLDGPRTARTRDYLLRFPTMSEIYAELDDRQETSVDDVKDVLDEARKVQERVEDLSREMLKQGESSWENQQEMQRALEQQQKMAGELDRARGEIEKNLQDLSESEFATLEAMQKMEQIRKLLDEVATTEMKEALEKLQKALEEANPRRRQEDLAEFQESQDELMKQLDRIMENLKQFRLEEKMRATVRELEELAARQERVNDELAQLETPDEAPDVDPEAESTDSDPSESNESDADESDADKSDADESDADKSDADKSDADKSDADKSDADKSDADKSDADKSDADKSDADKSKADESKAGKSDPKESDTAPKKTPGEAADEKDRQMKNLARQEEKLSEEARRLEETLKELAEMTRELRDSKDSQGMQELSEKMDAQDIPKSMEDMAEDMQEGNQDEAKEQGEKALTQLRDMLGGMQMQQQGMAMRMIQISQAAINRAVRDLLALSTDEEALAYDLSGIPRNSASATRSFADEQYLLIQGAERVESMLQEVAKDTPMMESSIGRGLDSGVDGMRDAAFSLENGAVNLARNDGEKVVDELNSVVIALLKVQASMSSCPSGMPMSGMMQQLQELSGDQQKLNDALQKLMSERGQSMDHRLQGQMDRLGSEQRRIQEQLQQLLDQMGSAQGLLGRLDDVAKKLDETADRLEAGEIDEGLLRDQAWALTRLLDSQRSMRERDLGRERKSETAEDLAELAPPGALPDGLEEMDRDLREDLLKALDRRYPPKYEELIRRYFRSLSEELPGSDLP